MKLRLIAIVPAFFIATLAQAQSSVTLYGLIDEGINYTSNANGHSTIAMRSGSSITSDWGLLGTEDLGGGYKAVFNLQNSFDLNTGELGSYGREFGLQAYVGISSDQFGTVTFGRQWDPTIDLYSPLTATGGWAGDYAMHPYDNDNATYDFGVANSIKYVSPVYRGLKAEAMYGFSNSSGFADNRLFSAALQYQTGGLTAALGFLQITNPGIATGAVSNDAVFQAASHQNIDAAVQYNFGKAKVGVAYSHTSAYDPTRNNYFTTAGTQPTGGTWKSWKFDNFEVNGQYFVQPDLMLGAAYTYTMEHLDSTVGNFEPKWHQLTLELSYSLSKRTSVYVQSTYEHVVSAHTGTQFDFATNYSAAGMSSTGNQLLARVGLMHRF